MSDVVESETRNPSAPDEPDESDKTETQEKLDAGGAETQPQAAAQLNSWHLATAMFLSERPEQATDFDLPAMMCLGFLMLCLQSIAVMGVFYTSLYPDCGSNADCPRGWCTGPRTPGQGMSPHVCVYCGSMVPLPLQETDTGVLNNRGHVNYEGFNETLAHEVCSSRPITPQTGTDPIFAPITYGVAAVTNWCDACHHAETGSVDSSTGYQYFNLEHSYISFFDSSAIWLCLGYLGLEVAREWRDIMQCQATVALKDGVARARHWMILFKALMALRKYFFLPSVLVTIPLLIVTQGADALRVCFNTVALVFLLDVDDVAYDAAVPTRIKASLERRAKTVLNDVAKTQDPGAVDRSMLLIVAFVVALVRLGILMMAKATGSAHVVMMAVLCWLAFVPGDVNMLLSGSKSSGAVFFRCVAQVFAAPVAGLFWFVTMMVVRMVAEQ